MMLRLALALGFLYAVPAGCTAIGDPAGGGGPADASTGGFPDSAPRPDAAAVDAAADAMSEPDAEPAGTPATVTAECLFLRTGPGTDRAKIPCKDAPQLWCSPDGDVCVPLNDTVEVTGPGETGAGCTEWFPADYRDYSGYLCGEYLQFPASAVGAWDKGVTLYPDLAAGPQG